MKIYKIPIILMLVLSFLIMPAVGAEDVTEPTYTTHTDFILSDYEQWGYKGFEFKNILLNESDTLTITMVQLAATGNFGGLYINNEFIGYFTTGEQYPNSINYTFNTAGDYELRVDPYVTVGGNPEPSTTLYESHYSNVTVTADDPPANGETGDTIINIDFDQFFDNYFIYFLMFILLITILELMKYSSTAVLIIGLSAININWLLTSELTFTNILLIVLYIFLILIATGRMMLIRGGGK